MAYNNVKFDKTIDGMRYIIKEYHSEEDGQHSKIESSIPNDTPIVYSIDYSEETNTFQMIDYIEIQGRRIKVMFNLDLSLRFVGYIYNDLDGGYDVINPLDYFREDKLCDTVTAYEAYRVRLSARLAEVLFSQEAKFSEENNKMLALNTKKDN